MQMRGCRCPSGSLPRLSEVRAVGCAGPRLALRGEAVDVRGLVASGSGWSAARESVGQRGIWIGSGERDEQGTVDRGGGASNAEGEPARAGRDLTRDCHSTVALHPLWLDTSLSVVWSARCQCLVKC